MDERAARQSLVALEESEERLDAAAGAVLRSEYSSMTTWGSAQYVRAVLQDVRAAIDGLSATLLNLAAAREAPWADAARCGVYRARARLEEGRWVLAVKPKAFGRRLGSKSPSAAVANLSTAINGVAVQLAVEWATMPASELCARDAGRLIAVAAKMTLALDTVVMTAGGARELGDRVLPAPRQVWGVQARLRDARLALTMANAEIGKVVIGVEARAGAPGEAGDVTAVWDRLSDVCRAVPDARDVKDEDVAVWLSGRQGPARIGELADAVRSLETTLMFLQGSVEERWGRAGRHLPVWTVSKVLCARASRLGVAARESVLFAEQAGEVPANLVMWQNAVQGLAVVGEDGIGLACEHAAARLSAVEVARLFRQVGAAMRGIAPMITVIGRWGVSTESAMLGGSPLLRMALEFRQGAETLDRQADRVVRLGRPRGVRRIVGGGSK